MTKDDEQVILQLILAISACANATQQLATMGAGGGGTTDTVSAEIRRVTEHLDQALQRIEKAVHHGG